MNSDSVLLHLSPPCTSQSHRSTDKGPDSEPHGQWAEPRGKSRNACRKVKLNSDLLEFAPALLHCQCSAQLHGLPAFQQPPCHAKSLTEGRTGSSSHKMTPSLCSAADKDSDPRWFLTILISVLLQELEKAPGCSSLRVDGSTAQPNTIPSLHCKASLRSKWTAGLKI